MPFASNMTMLKNYFYVNMHNNIDDNVVRVLVNGLAEIKCDVSSNIESDQVLLVVWYKNNLPIYRWALIFIFKNVRAEFESFYMFKSQPRKNKYWNREFMYGNKCLKWCLLQKYVSSLLWLLEPYAAYVTSYNTRAQLHYIVHCLSLFTSFYHLRFPCHFHVNVLCIYMDGVSCENSYKIIIVIIK